MKKLYNKRVKIIKELRDNNFSILEIAIILNIRLNECRYHIKMIEGI